MVTSPHYLASLVGARILLAGGNAMDAAVATNAALNVVYPAMCSPGGDGFMLLYLAEADEVRALNASGRSPYRATRDFFLDKGMTSIPSTGILPVTVPGIVDGWDLVLREFGTMSFEEVLRPAIEYAEQGFPVSDKLSSFIKTYEPLFSTFPTSTRVFLKDGRPYEPGEILVQHDLARTFRKIAQIGRDAFYDGEIGEEIVKFSHENEGLLTLRDLKNHNSNFVDPIKTVYRGYEVYAFPPNSQGLTTLLELNIVEGFDLVSSGPQTADCIHLLVEAKKLAFADRDRYLSDPDFVTIPVAELLSKDYATKRREEISLNEALKETLPGKTTEGDTVYLGVMDGEGNAVSLIQSIFHGFGSGMVAGKTGVLLQNRGAYFSLDGDHPNRLEPHKRTLHTLSPLMVFKDEKPVLVFGTMGGDGQPQTHLQVITNIIDFKMNIQDAIEAPRWRSDHQESGYLLHVENRIEKNVQDELKKRGHTVNAQGNWVHLMGHAQGITINQKTGVLTGGADPRGDGSAVAI
jgi:gamma-glutamyltranspeptidase